MNRTEQTTDLQVSSPEPEPECPACDKPLRDDHTCGCGYVAPDPDYDLITDRQAEDALETWENQHDHD